MLWKNLHGHSFLRGETNNYNVLSISAAIAVMPTVAISQDIAEPYSMLLAGAGAETILIVTAYAGFGAGMLAALFGLVILIDTIPVAEFRLGLRPIGSAALCSIGMVSVGMLVRFDRRGRLAVIAELRESDSMLESLFDHLPAAVMIVEPGGRVHAINAFARALFGLSPDKVLNLNANSIIRLKDGDQGTRDIIETLAALARSGKRRAIEAIGLPIGGDVRALSLGATFVPGGSRQNLTIFVRDDTDAIAATAEFHELQDELLHMARLTALGEMGSAIAHELNQPLAAAVNYLGVARTEADCESFDRAVIGTAVRDATEQVFRAGSVLSRLHSFVTRLPAIQEDTDARAPLLEIVKLTAFAIRDAGASLVLDIDQDMGMFRGDRIQIQQVLLNLVRNALEAMAQSPRRIVTLHGRLVDERNLAITVSDTGPGITPAMRANLFKAFSTTKSGGLGVGLSISRTIIRSHGGMIGCRINTDGGADFWFSLPRSDVPKGGKIAA
jgi:two-component system sensor kinase FixL